MALLLNEPIPLIHRWIHSRFVPASIASSRLSI